MKRSVKTMPWPVALVCLFFFLALPLFGCRAKPSATECREAIDNIGRIVEPVPNPNAAVRTCQASSSKEAVNCLRNAKTVEDLKRCEGELGEKSFQEEMELDKERRNKEKEAKNENKKDDN